MSETPNTRSVRVEEDVRLYRARNPAADHWAAGYGVIEHTVETQSRIFAIAESLSTRGVKGDGTPFFEALSAGDRISNAGIWLVVHETYARNVYLDGRDLSRDDFKPVPEGHTGGSLNMVPAYVGYMVANAVSGVTRAWLMGQGHTVAAIDSVNLLLDNMTPAHAKRYGLTDEGLTRYVRDFYGYRIGEDGRPSSPLGSHVNPHTAGGLAEGGYLGIADLQYVHMPLPGERLVVFLSDGAFEEQRGSDWAPRWWRADDSGLVTPIMINNGRRIDQRTTMSQSGGADWFVEHLKLSGFDPIVVDGRDPAAFVWAVLEMEARLEAAGEAVRTRGDAYPVRLPYTVAVAPKGFGFAGAGTNLAHNLPLMANPHRDADAARRFNESARRIWVPAEEVRASARALQGHAASGRPKERDHPLVHRNVVVHDAPLPAYRPVPQRRLDVAAWKRASPMAAVDEVFLATVRANPHLRPRVGNPDEMKSNRMLKTLEALKFRVTDPEPGLPESVHGAVVTALNEEAVIAAAVANKGGVSIAVTYEAFAPKMHGVLRQEITFAAHCAAEGRAARWLSVPLVLTSHTWENSKNEQSHQDPAMAEAMLGEQSDVSRVIFVADYNTAAAALTACYRTRGQFWTLVVPKGDTVPDLFTAEEAGRLVRDGGLRVEWAGHEQPGARVVLTAVGAYQLEQVLQASVRLRERGVAHSVVYLLEPGRFRAPRSAAEAAHLSPLEVRSGLYPDSVPARVFLTHTRPEPMLGALSPLSTGSGKTVALGFINQGGTVRIPGLLYLNRSTWAHVLEATARVLSLNREELLTEKEIAALDGRASPDGVII